MRIIERIKKGKYAVEISQIESGFIGLAFIQTLIVRNMMSVILHQFTLPICG